MITSHKDIGHSSFFSKKKRIMITLLSKNRHQNCTPNTKRSCNHFKLFYIPTNITFALSYENISKIDFLTKRTKKSIYFEQNWANQVKYVTFQRKIVFLSEIDVFHVQNE